MRTARHSREVIAEVVEENEAEYDITSLIGELQHDMEVAARNLQFERAAVLRDQIKELKERYARRKDTERTAA